jgi:opacity protein-like surface antigen
MKKICLPLFISLLFAIAADAKAEESPTTDCCCADMKNVYAKIFGGANFLQSTSISKNRATYDVGYIFAGSLGYCWRYGLHWEGEYAFRRNGIDKISFFTQGNSNNGHFQTSSYMANMLWYVPLSTWGCGCWDFRPLIGAGIGYDFQQMIASNSRIVFNQKWYVFSWQAIVGMAYTLFCNTEFTLEYKFHQADHFYNHAIGIGLAYKYGLK